MATDAMRQLIDYVYDNEGISEALIDIAEFKLGIINRFSREDTDLLADAGFTFTSPSTTQRKNEIRAFLNKHPECMSGDFETMIDKITYYIIKKRSAKEQRRSKQRQGTKRLINDNFQRFSSVGPSYSGREDIEEASEEDENASKKSRGSHHSKSSKASAKSRKSLPPQPSSSSSTIDSE